MNTEGGVARYISGSGTETLVMQYTVKEGHVTSKLDYRDSQALVSQNTEGGRSPVVGHVRQKSLFPMTDANLDITHITSMADDHNIAIDGTRPRLSGLSFVKSQEGHTFPAHRLDMSSLSRRGRPSPLSRWYSFLYIRSGGAHQKVPLKVVFLT